MQSRGSFSGIRGIGNQDVAMWESMGRGPIIDRTREHFGRTDVAVAQFRRLMLDALQEFGTTGRVPGQHGPRISLAKVRSFEGILPKGTNWELLGLSDEELALTAKPDIAAAE